ncbi:hypothetical protein [Blastococcus sp. LR1]|uniref:hypothetical protein n=1 Tax=Blastococcus sp. LR1 TaxID=2877000 RepID=UPI001CCA65EE|nr:hypothetical protein [Blastococcus sp. LR1]MCA0144528.1 hypothetical protein [Blastococcus sp. LR1]
MDVLIGIVAMLVPASAIAAVLLPPVLLAVGRRRPLLAAGAYLAALAFVAAWVIAANDHMEWADRTGGQGSVVAGGSWLVLALAAATCSVVASLHRSPAVPAAQA